jgi:predicted DNA-binding transcriptional regulator YafY
VNPLGLVAKGSVWYSIASADDEVRSYRISRVRNATLTEFPSTRPVKFDLADYWQRSLSEFQSNLPHYRIMVRAAPRAIAWLRCGGYFARVEEISSPDADGWRTVSLHFDVEAAAHAYVLGFGAQMEVLEPLELRDRILQAAKDTIALYT